MFTFREYLSPSGELDEYKIKMHLCITVYPKRQQFKCQLLSTLLSQAGESIIKIYEILKYY